MAVSEKLVGDYSIIGTWDDTGGQQVLIRWHDNGIHCDVFTMDGCDYGGGISLFKISLMAKDVLAIKAKSQYDYDFHSAMTNLCR